MSKCIYAILDVNQKLNLGLKGLERKSIYTLPYREISAAISDIKKDRFEVDERNALLYGEIIEGIMERYTLVPVRFGTLVEDEREVTELLKKSYHAFVNNLREVKGKLEYGLKVLWDFEKVNLEICSLNIKDTTGYNRLKGDSPYKKYLLKKLKEHKSEEVLMERVKKIVEDIHNPLNDLSFSSRFSKMKTKRIILDAVYLVEKEKQDIFINRFKELQNKHKDLEFLFTGPWPPYNFVNNYQFEK